MSDKTDPFLSGIAPNTPLYEDMEAMIDAGDVPVDDSELDRVTAATMARLSPQQPRRRPVWALLAALGIAAVGVLSWPSADTPIAQVDAARFDDVRAALETESAGPLALVDTWIDDGDTQRAVLMLEYLQLSNPDEAIDYQNRIIQAWRDAGDLREEWAAVQVLRDRFGAQADGVEAAMRRIAVTLHMAGRDDPDFLQEAGVAYELYLSDFPAGPHDYDVRYAYAEMLYKQARYDEAYEQYHTVAKRDPEGKRSQFCAESAIFAADQMVALNENDPVWTRHLIEAADLYLRHWPDDPKVANVRYKAAYAAHSTGDLKDARTRFDAVIRHDPGAPTASLALDLIIDSYVVESDWSAMADVWLEYTERYPELPVDNDQIEALADELEQAGDAERADQLRERLIH